MKFSEKKTILSNKNFHIHKWKIAYSTCCCCCEKSKINETNDLIQLKQHLSYL